MAIVGTVVFDTRNHTASGPVATLPISTAVEYSAVLPPTELNRAAEISRLRDKLAERESVISSPEGQAQLAELEVATSSEESSADDSEVATIVLCDTYPGLVPAWPTETLRFDLQEGARLVLYDVVQGTTTKVETFWQLQASTVAPPQQPKCIDNEVIGIANDGLPIKNSESNLFGVFGPETLIGYARDGYPIYGRNDKISTDQCGGVDEGLGYRYYLSSERDGVLGCFTGNPNTI